MDKRMQTLIDQVQFNCDVSDSKYWGYFSICGLLMALRTLYMLKHGLEPWQRVDQDAIKKWISEKEARWEKLEDDDFTDLTVAGRAHGPFDVDAVNDALEAEGFVYGAGYGLFKKPTFFLADRRATQRIDGHTIYSAGKEHARDLFWSPGMSQGRSIFLRSEPLKALLWDKLMESGAKSNPALELAFSQYGLSPARNVDEHLDRALEGLVHDYAEIVLYHELGEEAESFPRWAEMIFEVDVKDAEFLLRAVKDLLADTSEHGPIQRFVGLKDKGRISLCIAFMDRYKLTKLYPEIREAFEAFVLAEDWALLEEARKSVYLRASGLRDELVSAYAQRRDKDDFLMRIAHLAARSL